MEPTMKEIAEWLNRAAEFFDEHGMPSEGSDFADRAAQVEAMEPTNTQWKAAIDPVMPPDFKDWHDNNINDLPEVAALVIKNLRERLEAAEVEAMGERRCEDCEYYNPLSDICLSKKVNLMNGQVLHGQGPDFGCCHWKRKEG